MTRWLLPIGLVCLSGCLDIATEGDKQLIDQSAKGAREYAAKTEEPETRQALEIILVNQEQLVKNLGAPKDQTVEFSAPASAIYRAQSAREHAKLSAFKQILGTALGGVIPTGWQDILKLAAPLIAGFGANEIRRRKARQRAEDEARAHQATANAVEEYRKANPHSKIGNMIHKAHKAGGHNEIGQRVADVAGKRING